jgi:cytoplasmic iron level regulating protein YaaA (DUF328/UPF0246 family)
VHILLPPSETKADLTPAGPAASGTHANPVPAAGPAVTAAAGPRPVDIGGLSVRGLTAARRAVLSALIAVSKRGDSGLDALGLAPGQRAELSRNVALRRAPAFPAGSIYSGVLYASLDIPTLPPDAVARLERSVLVFSGLWGVVRLSDRIPPYRCSIGVTLPGVGGLAAHWRRALARPMTAIVGDDLVLDLRSTGYATMWAPTGATISRTAAVRVLHERIVDGVARRSVVSHFNKATKGRIVRDLATAGAEPHTPDELATALRDLKYRVEQEPAAQRPARLDVIVSEL